MMKQKKSSNHKKKLQTLFLGETVRTDQAGCVCVCPHAPLRVCDPGSSEGVCGHVTVVVKW